MPFDGHGYDKVEPMTRKFVDWLESQDPNRRFDFGDADDCVLARFGRSLGYRGVYGAATSFNVRGHDEFTVINRDAAPLFSLAGLQTYGQVLKELKRWGLIPPPIVNVPVPMPESAMSKIAGRVRRLVVMVSPRLSMSMHLSSKFPGWDLAG